MTFEEALKRKIHKIRMPWWAAGYFVDPRVIENDGKETWAPYCKHGKPDMTFWGKPPVRKIMICEEEDRWEKF